jgi:hypothetical protein
MHLKTEQISKAIRAGAGSTGAGHRIAIANSVENRFRDSPPKDVRQGIT